MPRDVIPQVDVGSLTLNGLAAFSPLIAALTTDNVSAMAMIQLQNLGDLFHTSGRYAAKVPDLLQRCTSTRLDQLGMTIGWRKGDAASLMAKSAGGQAVTLLCFCLRNLYPSECGEILFDLSKRVLQRDLSVSSIAQLADVSQLLFGKLSALGFGNILAEEVVTANTPSFRATWGIAPSQAFCEEETLVPISGSQGMGYIVAVAAILFPVDTTLIIGSFIVREGTSKLISLEFECTANSDCPTQIRVEKVLKKETPDSLPINIVPQEATWSRLSYCFKWTGHIADWLYIHFADFGISCSPELIRACCDVLLLLPDLVGVFPSGPSRQNFSSLLGPEPAQRMYHVCRLVFRQIPSDQLQDVHSAYFNLVQTFKNCAGVRSECTCGVCDLSRGWQAVAKEVRGKKYTCAARNLWRCVGKALSDGFWCFCLSAQENATVKCEWHSSSELQYDSVIRTIHHALFGVGGRVINGDDIHHELMKFVGMSFSTKDIDLAHSNNSSTLCSASLLQLKRGLDEGVQYELRDGKILVDGRYYTRLRSVSLKARPRSNKSLYQRKGQITPTSSGEHSNLVFTVRELLHFLVLRTTAICNGQSLHLNLADIIISSLVVRIAASCEHNHGCELDEEHCKDVLTTSITGPLAKSKKIAITQTRGNPVAQLLACGVGIVPILQRDCCLNCAVKQAKEQDISQIIVI